MKYKKLILFFTIFAIAILMTGCEQVSELVPSLGGGSEPEVQISETPLRSAVDVSESIPVAAGIDVYQGPGMSVDYTNAGLGYVVVNYLGSHTGKIKLGINYSTMAEGSSTYYYDFHGKTGPQVIPITEGDATYVFTMFEQVEGDSYSTADTLSLDITLDEPFGPFLHSNQFVDFSETTKAITEAKKLYEGTSDDLSFIAAVYNYTMKTIEYDESQADQARSGEIAGYLPVLDEVVDTNAGICFDYAAVMTAMLRSQGVPTKMVLGYASGIYHAWVSVYTEETGWMDNIIEFDGLDWELVDPTFGDNNNSSSLKQYIGEGDNYVKKFTY